jgi:hypothetical protein
MAFKKAVTLRDLIGRRNDDERKLGLAVIGHSWFSEFKFLGWFVVEDLLRDFLTSPVIPMSLGAQEEIARITFARIKNFM